MPLMLTPEKMIVKTIVSHFADYKEERMEDAYRNTV